MWALVEPLRWEWIRGLAEMTAPSSLTWSPLFAKHSIDDGKKVKIAAIHSDFIRGNASVPDGIRWSMPHQSDALEARGCYQAESTTV